jgi:endonuclease/exonuclease/phosphatase (EEP) superfamily protein YafD
VLRDLETAAAVQTRQVDRIRDVLSRFADPTVIAGDFNSVRNGALHRTLRSSLVDTWEVSGSGSGWTARRWGIPFRIDYIYTTKDAFHVDRARTLDCDLPDDLACSDHRAMVTELRWHAQ